MNRKIGAEYLEDGNCKFCVWAPFADEVELILEDRKEAILLNKDDKGYWENVVSEISPGNLYKFSINGKEFPDPASKFQPKGVHSWSQVIAPDFPWKDEKWKGIPLSEMIIYELHTGTFTPEGTFNSLLSKLDHLKELGINTIEIMPISQFPGNRNWGYDGVYPFAVQESYGKPEDLKNLVDQCHSKGIAVILDVVYNHLGPEGNYLNEFGPYFTEKYKTPWGSAINYDDKFSDEVRNFFLQSALMWLEEYHFDGLRLDAVHEIIDRGANHFLNELSQRVDALEEKTGRKYILIAESDLNDVRLINPYEKGGYGLEAQWVDDFHHSVHTFLTGENEGYYSDFGKFEFLQKTFQQAFVYDGIYSDFRKKSVGNSPAAVPSSQFVVCIQNHDQVGNRMLGERLSELISFESLKLAAGFMLVSPYVPMLFMGEEFAEKNPFQYFVSHGDTDLVKAVQEGRKREFEYFFSGKGDFPDPQSEKTFENSKLHWNFRENSAQNAIFEYYKELIRLRKRGNFSLFKKGNLRVNSDVQKELIFVYSEENEKKLFAAFNFSAESQKIELPEHENDFWQLIFASAEKKWNGNHDFPKKLKGNATFELPERSLLVCEN